MSFRDMTALLLIIGSPLVQTAASGAQTFAAVIITPPVLQPRGEIDANWIGYKVVGTGGTFSPYYCADGFAFSTSDTYGACCTLGFVNCRGPTTCPSGTLIWPDAYSTYCGQGFLCSTGTVGGLYDAVATTNPAPSISVIWCASEATEWTAWNEVTYVKAAINTDGTPVYIAETAASITRPTTSQLSTTSTPPSSTGASPGSQTPSTAQTFTPTGSQSSSGQSPSPTAAAAGGPKDNGLGVSTGALIGIVISAVCSVVGLAFGIGFKIYKYRKEQKRQKAAAAGLG
ncbi:uncharacterized protein BDZ99DRAFT_151755 [Mytilinidion resinicola]|uniref:Uncharacterized protein n=1 Tax=Mytilinidion resinicola TaxID=574789 RepID=A0A6A6Y7F1_9PEZI|nr:uncharacterized protein BDZ99DRAFT_151755 [Mytilinidion resinicola]KAF2804742.1 hypothetical protein BDZ99DRAFT_151755 [Mytilinidion resinicola]